MLQEPPLCTTSDRAVLIGRSVQNRLFWHVDDAWRHPLLHEMSKFMPPNTYVAAGIVTYRSGNAAVLEGDCRATVVVYAQRGLPAMRRPLDGGFAAAAGTEQLYCGCLRRLADGLGEGGGRENHQLIHRIWA